MFILVVSTALVAATALLLSARLAEGSVTQLFVGAYVIAFAEIVVVSLLLSMASALTRTFVLASVLGVFCMALAAVRRVRFPPFRSAMRSLLDAGRDPAVVAVAILVLGVIGYSVALALFVPQNNGDAVEYHLARAAFWKQQHAVGYIDGAADARLDGFPPNSEIAMAFTMITSGSGRFAPLVQLAAALATVLAVYGISRRVGLGLRAALFGALLFLTLPVVALQASTGLNDIVLASFVPTSAFFLLSATQRNRVLAAIAVALMMGAKLTGILALPALAFIAVATRRRRPTAALAALASAAAIGAYWYWINLVRAGDPLGSNAGVGAKGSGGISGGRVSSDAVAAIARVIRLGLASIELPGAIGLDRLLYVAAAALLVVVAFITRGSTRERGARAALAATATLAPLALVPLGRLLLRGSQKFFFEVGRPDVGYLDSQRSATKASPIFSWYGPLGVLLTLVSCAFVIRAVRRRQLPGVVLLLAAAPALWIVLVGIVIPYAEWNGRFAMGGFALAAATWGVVLRIRPLAWATAAVALLTTTLAFVHLHDRPSGLRLIEPTAERSVWSQPDWNVEATDHPALRALLRFVQLNVPSHTRLALEPNVWPGGSNEGGWLPVFTFFGPHLSRTIVFADSIRAARDATADWAVLRDDGIGACVRGWDLRFRYDVWIVLRRTPGSRCD